MKKFKQIKIAIMSVADIKNYGDTLFPFVARKRILKDFPLAKFRFFTPTDCVIENEQFYKFTLKNLNDYNPDIILTIGGEVIHKYDRLVWGEMYHDPVNKPSDTIFGWLDFPAKYKAWFSVGVLDLPQPMDEKITDEELGKLDYIGVRGILSKKIIENKESLFVNPHIDIVPDIGWTFAKFFKNYRYGLIKLSIKNHIFLYPDNYIIFNINWTSINYDEIINSINVLDKFSKKTNLKIVILDVISTYKKIDVDIDDLIKNNPNIIHFNNCSLNEIGSLLCGCKFYVGSSLHCAMTTLSNCKMAALIHNTQLTKFQDMFGHMMRTDLLTNDWSNLENVLEMLNQRNYTNKKLLKEYVRLMQNLYEFKFKNLISNIKTYL